MTGRPKLDRTLADQMLRKAAASERRHRYLTDLARRHHIELPAMRVGDDNAVDHALDLLQEAGADIDWTLIDVNSTTEPRKP